MASRFWDFFSWRPRTDDAVVADRHDARREAATERSADQAVTAKREALTMTGGGMVLDSDDDQFTRITGNKMTTRDLQPLQQDQMLKVTWYLYEMNAFARRLISLMTDLILGEGITVQADDARVQEQVDATWNHPVNLLRTRIREFYHFLAVSGELALPVADNEITGRPIIGFIDPFQIRRIIPDPNNVLIPDILELKPMAGQADGQKLKIVRANPETGQLEGEVFFHAINKLPNSLRGRSDLLALADFLDLYDQYVFAETERVALLSAFVWDWKVDGITEKELPGKMRQFPKPKPGTVFLHNEKESLDAVTPDLKAQDRSEIGHFLRTHIVGSYGFPLSYMGDVDSNRATIEGQNDIMLKTPAARQKDFGRFIEQVVDYTVQHTTGANPALFRGASLGYKVVMPEIAAKDIARVGAVIGQVASALDTALANETMSKEGAIKIMVQVTRGLGVELSEQAMTDQIDAASAERQAKNDQRQADLAAGRAALIASGGIPAGPEPAAVAS